MVLALLAFGLASAGGLGTALAADDDGTFDVTVVDWDLSEDAPPLGQQSPSSQDTSEADPWCTLVPSPGPDATYVYKIFTQDPPSPSMLLRADEYDPTGPGPYPVMVLVHGGAWAKGCRYSVDGVAYQFARSSGITTHFIAISIDYRLACDPDDPDLQGSIVQPFCGWTYSRIDPARGVAGAAIFDVQDAVAWVRNVWSGLPGHPSWNGKVALVGASAGGNLSLMAATLATGGSARPDAVAGLSPAPRLTRMLNDTVWGCDEGQTREWKECAIGTASSVPPFREGGVNRYLPCQDRDYPHYQPVCDSLYQAASPWDVVDSQEIYPPPTYMANGGGPTPGVSPPEVSSLQEAEDFDNKIGPGQPTHRLCTVDSQEHATHLLPLTCEGDPISYKVRQSLDDWLAMIVCDPQHVCSG